jgi:hypothetical protein
VLKEFPAPKFCTYTLLQYISYGNQLFYSPPKQPMTMKNMILILFLLVGTAVYAQKTQVSTTPVGNEPLLKENTVLTELSAKVNAASAAAASGSRTTAAQSQADLKAACDAYRAELTKQISTSTNAEVTAALNRELSAVNIISPADAQPKAR